MKAETQASRLSSLVKKKKQFEKHKLVEVSIANQSSRLKKLVAKEDIAINVTKVEKQ